MDAQELRNLQEAYLEVVSNQLDEGFKKFPSKKVYKQAERKLDKRKPTGFRFDNVEGQVNTMMDTRANFKDKHYDAAGEAKSASAANRNRPASEKRSKTISDNSSKKSFPNRLKRSGGQGIHDSYDYYDIILSHLLDEGYAETPEAAEAIMVNMSEEWRDSILG
jgi:hypothetical protein